MWGRMGEEGGRVETGTRQEAPVIPKTKVYIVGPRKERLQSHLIRRYDWSPMESVWEDGTRLEDLGKWNGFVVFVVSFSAFRWKVWICLDARIRTVLALLGFSAWYEPRCRPREVGHAGHGAVRAKSYPRADEDMFAFPVYESSESGPA